MGILEKIESGRLVSVEKVDGRWTVNQELKVGILQEFANNQVEIKDEFCWKDKIDWMTGKQAEHFRMCPGAWVRRGVFIGKKVVLMPCFVNIGAHIGAGTMIDSGVTVGSCAYVGNNCHISANVVLAGVLEPVQAQPVIVEDGVFIGAGCIIAEGVKIGKNSVIAAGTILTSSTKIYDRSKETFLDSGCVPENAVVVPGAYNASGGVSIQCAVIIKTIDDNVRQKTSLNELLRI